MGGITSGVGLFSGINSAQLIDQLLALEQRPKQQVQTRIVGLQQQRAAYLDINTTLLALKTASQKFRVSNSFRTSKAESSNAEALTATAGTNAAAGSYSFIVKRLVSSQQQLSRGFTDADSTGVGATSFTFELGGGTLSSDTRLSDLNGGAGVERGKIVVTDATGSSATIDLSTAITVGDVLEAINTTSSVRVKATVDGDRIKLTDNNTTGSGTLTVTNDAGYNTATSLGIAKSAASGFGNSITGDKIRTLSGATALSVLNDGKGVNIRDGGEDLIVTDREGTVHRIQLGKITSTSGDPPVTTTTQTTATTLQDVINAINSQSNGKITAAINADKTGLVLNDTTAGSGNLIVASGPNGRTTAKDLGLETAIGGIASSSLSGKRLISGLNSTLVRSLAGGSGLTATDLTITDRSGNDTTFSLSAGVLNGSVDDLINEINTQLASDNNGVRVELNRAGNGLALVDDLSGGNGNIISTGGAATALGIEASGGTGGSFNGTNLQSAWLGRATKLSSLNGGRGIGTGTIRVTDASGATANISITDSIKTVDDLVQFLGAAGGVRISADINANGDGIVVRDASGGTGTLKIEDTSGTVAKSLNLVGSDDNDDGATEINGSYERTVSFNATDSLNTVVSKINSASLGMSATIIRDGSGNTPFRLSLSSQRTGSVGRMTVDTGNVDLGLTTLSRGDDAVAFYGSGDPARGVLLTSSSNTLDNVIQGVTIDLKQTSDQPVTLVVSRDTTAVEKAVTDFIDAYNAVITKLDRYDSYDLETQQSTALFGDSVISTLRSEMRRTIQSTPIGVDGTMQRMFQVGVKFEDGSKLTLDREKFRIALEQDPANVEALFGARDQVARENLVPLEEIGEGIFVNNTSTTTEFTRLGVAEMLGELVTKMTSSVDGTLTRRGRNIDSQITSQQARIVTFDQRLAAKRARLERQFVDMEKAIASLQSQSGALSSIRSF